MKDTNSIAREQQRRNAELAAEMREALRPMPPMTRTDGWTGYTWADLSAYAALCVRDERERCAKLCCEQMPAEGVIRRTLLDLEALILGA